MNALAIRALNKLRVAHARAFGFAEYPPHLEPDASGEAAGDLIREHLLRPEPCMIARFGRTELTAIARYLYARSGHSDVGRALRYIRQEIGVFWWDEAMRVEMRDQSGFFPGTDSNLDRFAERMLVDMKEIDLLGAWLPEELRLADRFPDASVVPLADLEPYMHARPWSEALEGRTVLVIHPFEETIRSQYARREEIFPDRDVLPRFELRTLRAVQSVVGTEVEYASWFDALDWMCERMAAIDFEVAVIGAGAYGMPLAAQAKRLGKQAVHLGGATQLLFGIRGKRWDDRPEFHHLFNDAWVHPSPVEVPRNYHVLEEGAYW